MMNIGDQAVSGKEWRERFSHRARFGIMTKRGFLMQGSFMKEFASWDQLQEDMRPGYQVVPLPISVYQHGQTHV